MTQALDRIAALLRRADADDPPFPPTLLFEEGWMLRLVLDWFAARPEAEHELAFAPGARWFSEARLASAFLPRWRGDPLAEGYTHADGAIGHFSIGRRGQAELALDADARQFVVVEAKMFSGLSKGTTRAPTYNQAARNVACMAELAGRAGRAPEDMAALGFFVLAPRGQIEAGVFAAAMDRAALERAVRDRAGSYDPPKDDWLETRFRPALDAMRIGCLAWEDAVAFVEAAEPAFGSDLRRFYERCLAFNRPEGGVRRG